MGNLNQFFRDLGRNAYGLGENVASLGSAAIAEPVAGFAAMYDPANGAAAIREGMTYTPRTQAGQMYQQGAARTLGAIAQPAMPVIDAWQRGVDIAGGYSPVAGAALRTVPTAIGIAMGAKPALQAGRQVSESLGAMQARMVANANAPRTLNAGYMGQRGAIGIEQPKIKQLSDNWENQGVRNSVSENGNRVMLSQVVVPKELRNQGIGSKYMQDLIDYADSVGKRVELSPSADFGGNKNKLKEFYSRFGFVENKGRNKDFEISESMYRPSQPITPKRPLTEFEQAHLTAQRNAALPVEKGGLGLPADNTAMDRARAMGFDVDNPVYHGTGADIDAFDPKLLKETSQYMKGVFTTDKPDIASNYGDTVYPLVQKQGYTLKDKRTDRASGKTPKEVDTIRDKDKNIIVTTKPENIRSRFAAFDPFNRDSSNLLAQSAKLAPTTALGAYMYNEKHKQKKQGQ